jgi:hypothetical protein
MSFGGWAKQGAVGKSPLISRMTRIFLFELVETFQERFIGFSENWLLDLTPFRTANRQFSLPLSKMERGKTGGRLWPTKGQG